MKLEISPVRDVDGNTERCKPDEAWAFAVYLRTPDNLAEWLADFEFEEHAQLFVDALCARG